ncbi:MAG: metallophosphoesterase [Nitrosopumilaceae archaeon]|nr:metallophosphoesterase [Nitrosopumilaceae archaeon]
MFRTNIIPNKPAMILEGDKKYLIITDIHIGFENSLAVNEIYVGKNSTINETLQEILELIEQNGIDTVILLGDVKSTIKNISRSEWDEVPMFLEKLSKKANIVLIPGNHDSNIEKLVPENITITSSYGMVLDDVLLTHGHTMPSENFSYINKIIMGHIHPVFFDDSSIINGQRVWLSIKTKKENIFPNRNGEIHITVVPSFNKYFYATQKRTYKRSISPIIEKIKQASSAKIITLDGSIIGDEALLSQVI